MKKTKIHFFAIIVLLICCTTSFCLESQEGGTMNADQEKIENLSLLMKHFQNNIDSSEFDIHIQITDSDGHPLDNVELDIKYARPDLKMSFFSEKQETQNERRIIGSEIHIQKKGWSNLILSFRKEGYYSESRRFEIDFMREDISNYLCKQEIQVKLFKKGIPAELDGIKTCLNYDFIKNEKSICDLSTFRENKTANKKENKDKDEEDNRKKTKNKIVNLETISKATKYLELDFRRDSKGDIIYSNPPTLYRNLLCPSTLVIRFQSDAPDDGLIVVNKDNLKIKPDQFKKEYTTAPEKGYDQKEIAINLEEKDANGRYLFESEIQYVFLKCGNHYGKAKIGSISVLRNNKEKKIYDIRMDLELIINKKESDRNLNQ
jgi:outer membrane lipoprotein-sorting protein